MSSLTKTLPKKVLVKKNCQPISLPSLNYVARPHLRHGMKHELFYFQSKFELLDRLKSSMVSENMINTPKLNIKFCDKNETPPKASSTLLPIMIHSCPEDFSTVDYFDVGRRSFISQTKFCSFFVK